ncbi:hypothetical protein AURDEDRAFT_165793 [Auricularia subglabra TFB-10046 SS5]|nr:hypothetical protein AURDEDRAFT_165793 [Auricularia subglabra TFB-10046 SS5]
MSHAATFAIILAFIKEHVHKLQKLNIEAHLNHPTLSRSQAQLEETDVDLDLRPISLLATSAQLRIDGSAAPDDLLPRQRGATSHLRLSGVQVERCRSGVSSPPSRESAATPTSAREREREILAVRGGVEEFLWLLGAGTQENGNADGIAKEEVTAPALEVLDVPPPKDTPSPTLATLGRTQLGIRWRVVAL